MRNHTRPSARPCTESPERRLLAAVIVRTFRDLTQASNPGLRSQAASFFDEEGIALTAALGIPARRVRQVITEACSG